MPLIDLKTDLRSLKYGKDTFGGGNSPQPFVRTSIPDAYEGKNNTVDFLGRQGGNIPGGLITYGANEFVRIGKFLKSPQGLQFIVKQEVLSKQESKRGADLIDTKPSYIYNPINTLLAAVGGPVGFHPYGKGGNINIDEDNKYYKVYPQVPQEDNVLVRILTTKQSEKVDNPNGNILSYQGGPGQLLFGKTNIKFADQRTGVNNALATTQPSYFYSGSALHKTNVTPDGNSINYNNLLGASKKADLDKPQDTGFTEDGQQFKMYGPESDNSTLSKNKGDYNIVSGSQYNQGKPEHAVESPNYNSNLGASNKWNKTNPGANNFLITPDQTGISDDGVSNLLFGVSAKNTTLSLNQGALNIVDGNAYSGRTTYPSNSNIGLRYNINPDVDKRAGKHDWVNRLRGASATYLNDVLLKGGNTLRNAFVLNGGVYFGDGLTNNNVYTSIQEGTFPDNSSRINFYSAGGRIPSTSNTSTVWNQLSLINYPNVYRGNGVAQLRDFRKTIIEGPDGNVFRTAKTNTVISNSPDYSIFNIESRLKLGDPGKRLNRNVFSYSKGLGKPLDEINARPVFSAPTDSANTSLYEDAIKFSISAIDNDNPNTSEVLQFRAFLNAFDDGYTSTWEKSNYLGRGDSFYNYTGFERSINLGFSIFAQSREELMPMYRKLNRLASWALPDYSSQGYMRGNLLTLTVGDYVVDQVGVMGGFTLGLNEGPWEIALNDDGNKIKSGASSQVAELPMHISVSGFKFTPIHNFLARTIKGIGDGSVNKTNSLFAFQKTTNTNLL